MEIRTRFAPSPTGYMHIGNLRTALYEYLIAKSKGGKFILRIEDTDHSEIARVDVIYKTLEMTGIKHDEGPDVGGEYGPYVQSERMGIRSALVRWSLWKRARRIIVSAQRKDLTPLKPTMSTETPLPDMTDTACTSPKRR